MALYIPDSGDAIDIQRSGTAWDFPETGHVYWIRGYPYKASNIERAKKLSMIRNKINILCDNIVRDLSPNKPNLPAQGIYGIDIFLGLHQEHYYDPKMLPHPFYDLAKSGRKTSRYLLSEIPKGTMFDGISKPRMRFIDPDAPYVGADKNGRALYRDIFLNLDKTETNVHGSNKSIGLKGLVIHELAHSLANHIAYRPDDHHADFKWAEKFITKHWPPGPLFQ
jgi:hypothetical protein